MRRDDNERALRAGFGAVLQIAGFLVMAIGAALATASLVAMSIGTMGDAKYLELPLTGAVMIAAGALMMRAGYWLERTGLGHG